jgi:formylglycine-generating enzyme required for sulfatase activity
MFQFYRLRQMFLLVAAVNCTAYAQANVFNMPNGLSNLEFVPVGNPGNAPEIGVTLCCPVVAGPSLSGAVGYVYKIGKYEVTAAQYTNFLNAVAKADPNGLYNMAMGDTGVSSLGANIQRTGSSPNYSYSVAADWADRPVNYVSFWDAARFANWLHNGQPTGPQGLGTTEDGAYHDVGDQNLFGRNAGAKFFIPTKDEWYKAAYHDKTAGLAASYFDYTTKTNSEPGNDITETFNPGNNANYYTSDFAMGSSYYRTVVGEFELSDSPYGTFDQGGNVWEWNETIYLDSFGGLGGAFNSSSLELAAPLQDNGFGQLEYFDVGFRVASIPEPASLTLSAAAMFSLVLWRRKK